MFTFKGVTSRRATGSVEPSYPNSFSPPPPRKTKSLFKPLKLNPRNNEVEEPRYIQEKRLLETFSALLITGLPLLEELLQSWASIASLQCKLAVLINQKTPLSDKDMNTRFQNAAKHTVKNSTSLRNDVLNEAAVPNVLAQLHRISTHVDKLRARHRDVNRAKSEFEASERRLRNLQSRNSPNRENLVRAKGRFERTRDLYNAMVDRMVERMVEVNALQPDVAKTMHYLFWILQEKASNRIIEATKSDMDDASAAEPLLCCMSFGNGLKDPSTMFHALVYRPGDHPPSRGA